VSEAADRTAFATTAHADDRVLNGPSRDIRAFIASDDPSSSLAVLRQTKLMAASRYLATQHESGWWPRLSPASRAVRRVRQPSTRCCGPWYRRSAALTSWGAPDLSVEEACRRIALAGRRRAAEATRFVGGGPRTSLDGRDDRTTIRGELSATPQIEAQVAMVTTKPRR
jgi:hypothetical protein